MHLEDWLTDWYHITEHCSHHCHTLGIQVLWNVTLCDWVNGAFFCKDKSSRKVQWSTHLPGLLTLEAEGTASLQNISKTQPVTDTLSHPRRLKTSATLLWDLTVVLSLFSYSESRLNRRFYQAVYPATNGRASSGSEDHICRYLGFSFEWRFQWTDWILCNNRLPVSTFCIVLCIISCCSWL